MFIQIKKTIGILALSILASVAIPMYGGASKVNAQTAPVCIGSAPDQFEERRCMERVNRQIQEQCTADRYPSANALDRCADSIRNPESLRNRSTQANTSNHGDFEADCNSVNINQDNCGIVAYVVTFTQFLSAVVGVVIVIMIAVGGIQYASARDNPQAVVGARNRIVNALIALVLYIFSFALLQWLVPGGII